MNECTKTAISRIYCYIHTLITKNKHYSNNNIVINIILYAIIESFINRSVKTPKTLFLLLLERTMCTVCLLFLLLIILIRITAPDRSHSRVVNLRRKKKIQHYPVHHTIHWHECAMSWARSIHEPIDRYRRIINMTVRYLKNLSFYATCTFKYKCTRKMYIVLLPLRTLRGIGTVKSLYGEYTLGAG